MRKLTALFLAALTVVSLIAGCAPSPASTGPASTGTTTSTATTSTAPTDTKAGNPIVQFPLEKEITYTFMTLERDYDAQKALEKNKLYNQLFEKTNVKLDFIYLSSADLLTQLNAMFSAGTEGDAIAPANALNDAQMAVFAASELLMPVENYLSDPEIMPNFVNRVIGASPATMGVLTAPDGHIYGLPYYQPYPPGFLESPFVINKDWLDKLKLEVPKTIEQFETVLKAFRDNDLNGNGNPNDEIPLIFQNGNPGYNHMEALLPMWGLSVKDSALDSYLILNNGKAEFAPALPAWKEAMSTIGRWYKEGLIWSEAFVANAESFTAKLKSETSVVGVYTNYDLPNDKPEYINMLPPTVEGFKTRSFYNPGINGNKNCFFVTRSCEQPEILMAWLDQFYDLETGLAVRNNTVGEGVLDKDASGMLTIKALTSAEAAERDKTNPTFQTITSIGLIAIMPSEFGTKVALTPAQEKQKAVYQLYKDAGIINTEIWPRPYLATEDATRIAELRTDIFNIVATHRAKWGTGEGNIEAEWDGYLAALKKAGVDEFVSIMQKTYDRYSEAMKQYK